MAAEGENLKSILPILEEMLRDIEGEHFVISGVRLDRSQEITVDGGEVVVPSVIREISVTLTRMSR